MFSDDLFYEIQFADVLRMYLYLQPVFLDLNVPAWC